MTFPKNNLKLALLISGSGSTMEAIIKACQSGKLENVQPVLVIASKENIGGIEKAKNLGMAPRDILVLNPHDFDNEEEFGKKIITECVKRGVNFIGQYGWMVKTPYNVLKAFDGNIINQHPGPLEHGRPDFGGPGMYGLRVHQARLEFVRMTNRDFWTEVSAHRVTEKFDEGAVVKSARVAILTDDTAETLQARALPVEHEIQISTLNDFVNNTVREIHRDTRMVLPGEEKILEECKMRAKKLYPNG
ncbi:hypothetical protein K8Q98_03200 [Candidatus Nomurabacteria bacterium]|nr:hypothetical protein [Candidatus Nomurabacteria bacterium]